MDLEVCLRHRFGAFTLDVDFTAPPGVTVLYGPSGSGKSSVVTAVAGLLKPQTGRIVMGGQVLLDTGAGICLPAHKRGTGYIFQDGRLFPHMTVRGNLRYGTRGRVRADEGRIIEMLGIGALLDRRPARLSGGERARVGIGRALLSGARMILADEPLAALDEARKDEILPYFERLRDETEVPVLYVCHSVSEVARLATSVVALRGGRVLRHGVPQDVLADPQIGAEGARDVGAVLTATLVRHHADGVSELRAGTGALWLSHVDYRVGAKLRVRIAAQDVILALEPPRSTSALNILSGTVSAVQKGAGAGVFVTLQTDAGAVVARITERSRAGLGLDVGMMAHAIVKSMAVAPGDVGG